MNLLRKLNMNVQLHFEQELYPISMICDDDFFTVLSVSECLRFNI